MMSYKSKNIFPSRKKKILFVLNSFDPQQKCSICGNPLYSARLESWQDDILVDFKFNNGFCEKCGLFEYEPIQDAEIIFQDEKLKEIYSNELKGFL